MVEAAIVFPLTIAAVMAVIYLMINLYSQTALQSSLHVELRGEAGDRTGLTERSLTDGSTRDKYRAAAESRSTEVKENGKIIHPYIYAEDEKYYRGNAMVAQGVTRGTYGRYYLVNEAEFIRNLAMVKNLANLNGSGEAAEDT
jgi:hypothetical protein